MNQRVPLFCPFSFIQECIEYLEKGDVRDCSDGDSDMGHGLSVISESKVRSTAMCNIAQVSSHNRPPTAEFSNSHVTLMWWHVRARFSTADSLVAARSAWCRDPTSVMAMDPTSCKAPLTKKYQCARVTIRRRRSMGRHDGPQVGISV